MKCLLKFTNEVESMASSKTFGTSETLVLFMNGINGMIWLWISLRAYRSNVVFFEFKSFNLFL